VGRRPARAQDHGCRGAGWHGARVAVAYSGSLGSLAVGYLATVLLGGAFAPAQGALASELVPTAIRATVAGWLTVTGVLGAVTGLAIFGVVADATGGFAVGAWSLGGLVAASALGFRALPETRGVELEDLEAGVRRPASGPAAGSSGSPPRRRGLGVLADGEHRPARAVHPDRGRPDGRAVDGHHEQVPRARDGGRPLLEIRGAVAVLGGRRDREAGSLQRSAGATGPMISASSRWRDNVDASSSASAMVGR
jgi:hypothetical protein